MFSEIRKSIASILYERTTSPLYGTLIISWCIVNWKIIYVTLFVSESVLPKNKVDYIVEHYTSDVCLLYIWPILLTIGLIGIAPFLSNGAYALSLWFRKKKIEQKNKIEGSTLITKDQYEDIQKEIATRTREYKETLQTTLDDVKLFRDRAEQLQTRVKSNDDDLKAFKIVNAIYGRGLSKYKDVTEILNLRIVSNGPLNFNVDNATFGVTGANNDPAFTHWKELLVTYQYDSKYVTFKAVEGDSVRIVNGIFEIHAGFASPRIDKAIKAEQDSEETQKAYARHTANPQVPPK